LRKHIFSSVHNSSLLLKLKVKIQIVDIGILNYFAQYQFITKS